MTDNLEQQFLGLIKEIDAAIARVEASEGVDFNALNKKIVDTCKLPQTVDVETAKALKLPMARLILKLDQLADCIRSYQERLNKAN